MATDSWDLASSAMYLLKEGNPDIKEKDIDNLINNLIEVSDQKRNEFLDSEQTSEKLDHWLPHRKTVKEIIRGRVRQVDLKYCIEDFRKFAQSKGWTAKDNLDAKLIGHIKIMVANNRISLVPVEHPGMPEFE